jgi:hypothetical protein
MSKFARLQLNNCKQQPSDCLGSSEPSQQSGGFCLEFWYGARLDKTA